MTMVRDEQFLIHLSAFIDGELPEAECSEMETALRDDPELQSMVSGWRAFDEQAPQIQPPEEDPSVVKAMRDSVRARTTGNAKVLSLDDAEFPEPPEIDDLRWEKMRQTIRAKTTGKEAVVQPASIQQPQMTSKRSSSRSLTLWAIAAAAAVVLTVLVPDMIPDTSIDPTDHTAGGKDPVEGLGSEEDIEEIAFAEVYDDNYVLVTEMTGDDQPPIVSFLLKDE